jgi:RNAse (barnase) inhibitor barstar
MVYELDGTRFSTLEEFFDEVSAVIIPGAVWGRNLDAFNDILRGGFGTPDRSFTIRWRNHGTHVSDSVTPSRQNNWRRSSARCHPENRTSVEAELREAELGRGSTVFDWLVEIIRVHGPAGTESGDRVALILD